MYISNWILTNFSKTSNRFKEPFSSLVLMFEFLESFMSSCDIDTLHNRNITWSRETALFNENDRDSPQQFISNAKKYTTKQLTKCRKCNQSRSYINYFQMFHWKRFQLEMCMHVYFNSKRKNVSLKTNFKMFISTEDHRFTIQM